MYCKHCGKEIADDSHYCRYCGTQLFGVEKELSPTDNVIKEEPTIVEKANVEETVNRVCDGSCVKDENTYIEETNSNTPTTENKTMKILGIASGILIWGIFAVLGLGLLVGLLFVLYMVIIMMMPNGLGITVYLIILGITIYLIVKLVRNIIKSFRK